MIKKCVALSRILASSITFIKENRSSGFCAYIMNHFGKGLPKIINFPIPTSLPLSNSSIFKMNFQPFPGPYICGKLYIYIDKRGIWIQTFPCPSVWHKISIPQAWKKPPECRSCVYSCFCHDIVCQAPSNKRVSSAHVAVFWQVSHSPPGASEGISLKKESSAFVRGDEAESCLRKSPHSDWWLSITAAALFFCLVLQCCP